MENEIQTWFNSPARLWSVFQSAVFVFVFIVVFIRLSGKRTTSQMNNFDWIVLVAIGSLASSGVMLKDVSVSDAVLAIVTITLLQWLTTWLANRYEWFAGLIKSPPRMLTHKGEFLKEAMRDERVSEAEIRLALRQQGYTSVEDANWVILESNGNMTVIPRQDKDLSDADVMDNVVREIRTG